MPETRAPITPIGDMKNSSTRLNEGASVITGCSTGVSVIGSSAKENSTDTMTKGTKPCRSPSSISHWPIASDTMFTTR